MILDPAGIVVSIDPVGTTAFAIIKKSTSRAIIIAETISGKVYINGELLDEPYLSEEPAGDFGPHQVPEDSDFMLGDNRAVSKDSRYWHNTYVKKDKIIAKAFVMYWPLLKWLG